MFIQNWRTLIRQSKILETYAVHYSVILYAIKKSIAPIFKDKVQVYGIALDNPSIVIDKNYIEGVFRAIFAQHQLDARSKSQGKSGCTSQSCTAPHCINKQCCSPYGHTIDQCWAEGSGNAGGGPSGGKKKSKEK